jgi:hypothetical protein
MAVAPAAAEIPVLAYLTVGLLALLAWVVLRGLRSIWIYTIGSVFLAIADVGISTGIFGKVHPFGFLKDANTTVMNNLERAATGSEHAVGYLFHGAAVIQGWIAKELFHLAADVWGWATWLQNSHLPRWVKAMIIAAVPPLVIPLIARALAGVHPTRLTRIAQYRIGITRRQVKAMIAAALATAGALAPGLPNIWPRVKGFERDLTGIWRRLRRLEALLGVTGAALLVARALGLGSARCVRSGNIGRAARRWCGLDNLIVDALMADLAFTAGTISLVELAKATQKAAPLVATSLVYYADEITIGVDEAEKIGKRALAILDTIA